jgi:hypothetical protein
MEDVMVFDLESGDQLSLIQGGAFHGSDGVSAIPLGPGAQGIEDYFRTKAWLTVSGAGPITIDNHPGRRFNLNSETDQELPLGFVGGLGYGWTTGETLVVTVVDVEGSSLLILGDHISALSQAQFDAVLDKVVQSIQFR